MKGNINMARNKNINLPDPARPTEPTTRRYVEANSNRGLTADGFTMRDHISMGGHEIIDVATNSSTGTAAVSKNYADTRYVLQNHDINMNNHRAYNLRPPTTDDDATTRKYVDDKKCVFKDGLTTTADIS